MPGLNRMLGDEPKAMGAHRRGLTTRQSIQSGHPFGLRRDGRLSSPSVLAVGSATAGDRRLDSPPSGRNANPNDYVNRA